MSITNKTEAVIEGSQWMRRGTSTLTQRHLQIDALAIGVSAGGGAVGIGLGANVIANTITAAIQGGSTLEIDGSLSMDAVSSAIIRTLSLGVSGGGFAVSVQAMGNDVGNTVTSKISDSEVYAAGDVSLKAQDIAPSIVPKWALPDYAEDDMGDSLEDSPLSNDEMFSANILAIGINIAGGGGAAIGVGVMGNVINNNVTSQIERLDRPVGGAQAAWLQ